MAPETKAVAEKRDRAILVSSVKHLPELYWFGRTFMGTGSA